MHSKHENTFFYVQYLFVEIVLASSTGMRCGSEIMGVTQDNGVSRLREENITLS